jgi:hypothetical protein
MTTSGQLLKDAGMDAVLTRQGPEFTSAVEAVIRSIDPATPPFRGEYIRRICSEQGVVPTHPNAWGAVISTMRKRGVLQPTGKYTQSVSTANHAHPYEEYTIPQGNP